jgi:SPASM domain peptide maturase of grasp-with-spasm system
MKNNIPFQLFACCIPVKGAARSVICDTQRRTFAFIPNSLFEILTEHEGKTIEAIKGHFQNKYDETIDEYFQFLVDDEFVFFTKSPNLFPKMELKWEEPAFITNAIIENYKNVNYENVFHQLTTLGCKHILLHFFENISISLLENILRLAIQTNISSFEIFLPYNESVNTISISKLIENFPFVFNLTLFNAPKNEVIITPNQQQVYLIDNEISNKHCGIISASYFTVNTKTFTESQHHNTCLNRKISIDTEGNIKNCPSMSQSFGNIKDTTLTEALEHSNFKKYWNVTKDQVSICKDCEFRHICTDCRAYVENPADMYSKPLKCGYNPYTCEWEEWSTNPLKQKAIQHYEMEELTTKVN